MRADEKPTCRTCGSDAVVLNATVKWDAETQQWVPETVSADYRCLECGTQAQYPRWVSSE